MPIIEPGEKEAFEADRLSSMRVRLVAIALLNAAIWASQALLYEDQIFPSRDYARPYRAAELLLCAALVWLAGRRRPMKDMEAGATLLLALLLPVHGAAMLVVHESCVVPFLLTMEWGQIVVALAALLSFGPACVLFGTAWVVGVGVVVLRPGFDADLSDHAVLLVIYGVVAASIRAHDKLRAQDFVLRRQLETANHALRRSDEARSRLFVNLSHDLRTPLALIRGEAHALAEGAPADNRATLARIEEHARDVADLADQLLEAARLDAGRLEPSPKAVDLGPLARQIGAQFSGGTLQTTVDVAVDTSDATPVVARVDPAHLRRVVFNLMSNAARQLRVGATRIAIRVFRDETGAVLEVTNDGPPIPEERREVIFERFAAFDAEGGMKSGIGLPVARELAELNGGSLTLLSGEPTVFRLRLPATDESPATVVAPDLALEQAPDSRTVPIGRRDRSLLLVEDHDELRTLLSNLLSSRFTVLEAGSGEMARRALSEHAPTIVLSDLMLPDGRGYDVLEYVRRHERLAETPVVFLSAIADEGERVKALGAGASDYVVKPFGTDELVARVEAACQRSAERRQALDEQREDFLGELHDGVNAALARAALLLESAERRAGEPGGRHQELVAHARAAVLDALTEARSLITLRQERTVLWAPAALELESVLSEAAAGFGPSLRFTEASDGSVTFLSTAEHHALCRVAVEAVTNAIKHAEPHVIRAHLEVGAGEVRLSVTNEVREPRRTGPHGTGFGLRAAKRRLERLGGSLDVGLDAGGAWRVLARLPSTVARVAAGAA